MEFNAKKEVENIVEFVRDYYRTHNLGGAVLGISGGKDSGVVLALLVKALGKENVVGLTLPCHSHETDKNLAQEIADFYGVRLFNLDLTPAYDNFVEQVEKGFGKTEDKNVKDSQINLKPKLRTASVYYYASMLSHIEGKPYLVVGTSNKCELYVGYFTKGGDNVHDIALIADFTVEEVIALGEELNVPKDVLYRTPSDGLSGMSDEDKLGVKYSDIASYMQNPKSVEKDVAQKIEKLHKSSLHKFSIPTYRRTN
ncbi:MAG: NAD(+) synthase [Clostridia bacterium]|nr:NAD(+) synthase [Clostridia bacterium]